MADISMQYVAGIRQYIRINHTRFDAEITDLIGAARADLLLGGISEKKVNDESDALIKRAIVVYVKAEFGLDNAAGTIALMKSLKKDITVAQARNVLYKTGADVYGYIPPMVLVDKALMAVKNGDFSEPTERKIKPVPEGEGDESAANTRGQKELSYRRRRDSRCVSQLRRKDRF